MSDAEGAANAVTKKIGPLPGWAWVLVVAGGAWGFKLYRSHSIGSAGFQSSPTPLSTDPSVAPGGFPAGTGNAGGGIGFGGGTGAVTGQAFGSPAVTSNAQWVKSTTDQMVAAGSDASTVANALTTYISGGKLDANGQSIVNQAITHYGAPPQGVLPVQTDATVPLNRKYVRFIHHAGDATLYGVTPEGQEIGVSYGEWAALGFPAYTEAAAHDVGAANVNQAHIYVVKDRDTLESIATRFYGSPDTTKIRSANPGIGNPPGIGSAIYVP